MKNLILLLVFTSVVPMTRAVLEKRETTTIRPNYRIHKTTWLRDGLKIYEGARAEREGCSVDEYVEIFYLEGRRTYVLTRKKGAATRLFTGGSGIEVGEGAEDGEQEIWLSAKNGGALELFVLRGDLYQPVEDDVLVAKRKLRDDLEAVTSEPASNTALPAATECEENNRKRQTTAK